MQVILVVAFLTAYCVQPLLVDVIKFNGGANVSSSGVAHSFVPLSYVAATSYLQLQWVPEMCVWLSPGQHFFYFDSPLLLHDDGGPFAYKAIHWVRLRNARGSSYY